MAATAWRSNRRIPRHCRRHAAFSAPGRSAAPMNCSRRWAPTRSTGACLNGSSRLPRSTSWRPLLHFSAQMSVWVKLTARDLTGLDAGGAHVDALLVAAGVGHGAHGLDVGIPPTAGPAMGVRHRLAEAGALPADLADGSHMQNSSNQYLGVWVPGRDRPRFDPTTGPEYRPLKVSPKSHPRARTLWGAVSQCG